MFSALLFILACLGATNAIFLVTKRLKNQPPVCSAKKSCAVVLDSQYRKIFGLHNDLLGLLFYATVAFVNGLMITLDETRPILWLALAVIVSGGGLVSIYFIYIQWHRLKAWCQWCLLSAAIVLSMTSLVVNQFLTGHLV